MTYDVSALPGYELIDFGSMTETERQAAFDAIKQAVPGLNKKQLISAQLNSVWARDATGGIHLLPTSRRKLAGLGLKPNQLVTLRKAGMLSRRQYGALWLDPAKPASRVYQAARAGAGLKAGVEAGKAAGEELGSSVRDVANKAWDFILVCAGLKRGDPPWTWKQCAQHAIKGLVKIGQAVIQTPLKVISNIIRNPILGILTAPLTIIAGAAKALDGAGMIANAAVNATLRAWDDLNDLTTAKGPVRSR